MSPAGKSGRKIGDESVARLQAYLDSIDAIPARNGKAHISAIAEAVAIDRQTLYKNPRARQLLEEAVAKKGLKGIAAREDQEDERIARLELQITQLEQKNSALMAENWELRRLVSKLQHVEMLLHEVVATVENGLRVRRPDGTEIDFIPGSTAASFDVGEARELKVAPGDWLLLQANHGKEFINGERVQVREIQNGRVALTDGWVLPSTFNTFTHGYAVTSHSSQGKTVDEVLLVASSRSFAAVNREQFYVSISRGRERCHVFTDDAELLARRVTDSHERQAAVELLALRQELAKLGFRQQLKEKTSPPVGEDSGKVPVRQYREHRPMRVTRLSPVQRLANLVEDVRRWIDEWFGRTRKETESVQHEKISPVVKETPSQKLRRVLEQKRQQHQQQRRSRGIHI